MTKQAKPTRKPFEVITKEVLGDYPEDVLAYIQFGAEALEWMESLFYAIKELNDKEGSRTHIKNLAGLGGCVSSDLSDIYGGQYEEFILRLEAALAESGERATDAIVRAAFKNDEHGEKIVFVQRSDNMAPEIPVGADVIVDTSITYCAKSGGLYLLNVAADPELSIAQHQIIKRLTKHDQQDLYNVSCANQHYQSYDLPGSELDIAGMVVGSVQGFTAIEEA